MKFKNKLFPTLIFLLLFIVYIYCFARAIHYNPAALITNDSLEYVASAQSLLIKNAFLLDQYTNVYDTFRTPGYPFFIALCLKVTPHDLRTIIILQIGFHLLTGLLIYKISSLIWKNNRISLFASILYFLNIHAFLYTHKILSETIFTFFITTFFYLTIQILKQKNEVQSFFIIGFLLAITTLIRPITAPLSLLIIPYFIIVLLSQKTKKQIILKKITCYLIPIILILGAWSFRNFIKTGYFHLSSVSLNYTYFYRAGGIIAQRDHIPFEKVRIKLSNEFYAKQFKSTADKQNFYKKQSFNLIKKYPKYLFHDIIYGFIQNFNGSGFSETIQQYSISNKYAKLFLKLFCTSYFYIFYILVLAGIISSLRNSTMPWIEISMVLLIVYFLIIPAAPGAYSRFRVPIIPLMTLLAGYGLNNIAEKFVNTTKGKPLCS